MAGLEPLGGFVALPPAKASTPAQWELFSGENLLLIS